MESENFEGSARRSPLYIMDGGLGTTLKDEYNTEVDGEARPLWSSDLLITSPEKLLEVQKAFVEAGAEVIITATYQASFEGFARTRDSKTGKMGIPESRAKDYMRDAVRIARESFAGSGKNGKTALSLGAYGAIMIPGQEYTGRYDDLHRTAYQLAEWHEHRLDVFRSDEKTWSNVDLIAFETIPLLAEIKAARMAMNAAVNADTTSLVKPFWISCVFPGGDLCLPDGSSVDMVVEAMLKSGPGLRPHAIGLNCTKINKVRALLEKFEKAVQRLVAEKEIYEWPALVIYPDGTNGEVYNTTTQQWEGKKDSDEQFVRDSFHQYMAGSFDSLLTVYRSIGRSRCLK